MRCPRCATEAPDDAAFCPQCGVALRKSSRGPDFGAANPGGGPSLSEPPIAAQRRSRMQDEPERDVWEGTYSPKAMLGVWIVLGLITAGALLLGVVQIRDAFQWAILSGLVALGWLVGAGMFLHRRLGVQYRLTTQRLFHEKGVLRRTIDRIEVIKMDDVSCEQGLLERLTGVGSIHIRSTDPSAPLFNIQGVENARSVANEIDQARRSEQVRRGIFIETSGAQFS